MSEASIGFLGSICVNLCEPRRAKEKSFTLHQQQTQESIIKKIKNRKYNRVKHKTNTSTTNTLSTLNHASSSSTSSVSVSSSSSSSSFVSVSCEWCGCEFISDDLLSHQWARHWDEMNQLGLVPPVLHPFGMDQVRVLKVTLKSSELPTPLTLTKTAPPIVFPSTSTIQSQSQSQPQSQAQSQPQSQPILASIVSPSPASVASSVLGASPSSSSSSTAPSISTTTDPLSPKSTSAKIVVDVSSTTPPTASPLPAAALASRTSKHASQMNAHILQPAESTKLVAAPKSLQAVSAPPSSLSSSCSSSSSSSFSSSSSSSSSSSLSSSCPSVSLPLPSDLAEHLYAGVDVEQYSIFSTPRPVLFPFSSLPPLHMFVHFGDEFNSQSALYLIPVQEKMKKQDYLHEITKLNESEYHRIPLFQLKSVLDPSLDGQVKVSARTTTGFNAIPIPLKSTHIYNSNGDSDLLTNSCLVLQDRNDRQWNVGMKEKGTRERWRSDLIKIIKQVEKGGVHIVSSLLDSPMKATTPATDHTSSTTPSPSHSAAVVPAITNGILQHGSTPPSTSSLSPPPLPLPNPGNFCFCSSIIQLLFSIPPFHSSFQSITAQEREALNNSKTASVQLFLKLLAIFDISSSLQLVSIQEQKAALSPLVEQFRDVLKECYNSSPYFGNGQQQDAHEFLLFVMDQIDNAWLVLRREKENKLFEGNLTKSVERSIVVCNECKEETVFTSNKSSMIQLQLPSSGSGIIKKWNGFRSALSRSFNSASIPSVTLDECFAASTAPEIVKAKCTSTACHDKERHKQKQLSYQFNSSVVFINFKRFHDWKKKSHVPVSVGEEVWERDGNKYSLIGLVEHQPLGTMEMKMEKQMEMENGKRRYEGGGSELESGHYIAVVKRDREWYECNDSTITSLGESYPTKRINKNPHLYVLVYVKL